MSNRRRAHFAHRTRKRFRSDVVYAPCKQEEPVIVHFVGKKPWVPMRNKGSDRHPQTIRFEMEFWRVYFRERTIVVGAGPSLRAPLGNYVDVSPPNP